jgi:hypothetical protein
VLEVRKQLAAVGEEIADKAGEPQLDQQRV